MAKGLEALTVSLTKNGYFKVAEVIKPPEHVNLI